MESDRNYLEGVSFKSPSSWSTPEDYILTSIENGSDATLLALADHLGIHDGTTLQVIAEPAFWKSGFFRVFLSHLAMHRAWIAELQTEFLRFGITAFVAHVDIEPTTEWQNEIELALMTAEDTVALLHEGFHQSRWTDQEVGFSMGRRIPVFSVRFGEDPYGFLGRFQALNGFGVSPFDLAETICDAYCRHKLTQKRMSEVLLGMFEHSRSFAEAKQRMSLLHKMHHWELSYEERLETSLKSNDQISGSFGVAARLKEFIKVRNAN